LDGCPQPSASIASKLRKKMNNLLAVTSPFSKNASESDQDLSNIRSLNFKISRRVKAIFALRTVDGAALCLFHCLEQQNFKPS